MHNRQKPGGHTSKDPLKVAAPEGKAPDTALAPAGKTEEPHAEQASVEEVLAFLAGSDLTRFRTLFKRMRERSPETATRVSLQHLAQNGIDDAGRIMLLWVATHGDYLTLLTEPDFLSDEGAVRVTHILRDADNGFFLKFKKLPENGQLSFGQFLRAVTLFEEVADSGTVAGWLRSFVDHRDKHIRSKAAKILCSNVPKLATVERQLKSQDARVRANAIEALWDADTEEAIQIFRSALSDSSHRVVVNALVGLYRRKFEGAFDKMAALTSHESAMMRAAAAWGLGEIGDERGIAILEKLVAGETSEAVQMRALRSLAALNLMSR